MVVLSQSVMASTRGGIKIGKKSRAFENFSKLFSPWLKGLKINWFASREITKPTEVLKPGLDQSEIYHFFILRAMLVGDCLRSSVIFVVFSFTELRFRPFVHVNFVIFCLRMFNICFLIWNWIKSLLKLENIQILDRSIIKSYKIITHLTFMNFPESSRNSEISM